ncbi:hypothetical protein Tco_0349879 [Tanacetum coccineum]
MVVSELLVINLHDLDMLNICARFGDMWPWVAPIPERQQVSMAGALGATKGAPVADEGAQAVLAPVIEEEVHKMRQSVMGLRGVVESSIT